LHHLLLDNRISRLRFDLPVPNQEVECCRFCSNCKFLAGCSAKRTTYWFGSWAS